jgi:phage-related protein
LAGYQLWRVQLGVEPSDWKVMPTVGSGVQEIRIRTEVEHRVLYVAKFEEGVYVLHSFQKRTQQTARRDIQIAGERLRQLVVERRRGKR